MKVGVLINEGKYSIYSIDLIKKEGHEVVCLIALKSKKEDSWMFKTPDIDILKLIAKAIGLPLVYKEIPEEEELDSIDKTIKEAKKKYKMRGLVSGVIDSIYQRSIIDSISQKLKLKTFSPLWHRNELNITEDMINRGYKIKIVSISADGLDKNWLGRTLNFEALEELKEVNKTHNISMSFENREADTIVLDSPIFNKKIRLNKVKKEMENKHTGKYIILETSLR